MKNILRVLTLLGAVAVASCGRAQNLTDPIHETAVPTASITLLGSAEKAQWS